MRFLVPALAAIVATAAIPTVALANIVYTFNVPVTLTNVSSANVTEVECSVYNGQNGQGTQLATGEGTLNIPTGFTSGTATVPVSSPTLPVSYKCWLLVSAKGTTTTLNIINGLPEEPQPGWTGKMLTTGNF